MDDYQFEKHIDSKYRQLKEEDQNYDDLLSKFSKLSRDKQRRLLSIIERQLRELISTMDEVIERADGYKTQYEKRVELNYEADKLSLRKMVLRQLIEKGVHSKKKKHVFEVVGKIFAFIIMLPSQIFFFLQLDIIGALIVGITSLAVWCCIVIWPINVFISLVSFNALSQEDLIILLGGSALYFGLLLALQHLPMYKDK